MRRCDEQVRQRAVQIAERHTQRTARMAALVDLLWENWSSDGLSWVGFYLDTGAVDATGRLVLGPRRDRPACSPIGMHGACGMCVIKKRPLVVEDVRRLGTQYIACDPLDQSELVIPCFAPSGSIWGVLDLDSRRLGYFDSESAVELSRLLLGAGLTTLDESLALSPMCV